MPSKFNAFRYGTGLYARFGPTITQSYIFAQVLDYDTVRLSLEMPDKIGQTYVVLRNNSGTSEDPTDGFIVSTGEVLTEIIEIVDTLVPVASSVNGEVSPSGTAYYTLFGFDTNGSWYKDAATSVVIPTNKKSHLKLINFLPSMYTSVDGNPFSPADTETDLQKFLYGFGLTFDELSSMIDVILPENRNQFTTRGLSSIFSTGSGMPNEYLIGVASNARLHRESGYVYRNKGTLSGLSTYVEALTGWETTSTTTNNKFLSLDDGSFEASTGNWSWNAGQMTLAVLPINGTTVVGPSIEFETSAYPFSRDAVGMVTLLGSSARVSLPGNSNRLLAVPVNAGKDHYLAIPVRAATGTASATPSIEWLDSVGTSLSVSILSSTTGSSTWQVAGGPVVAPDSAAFAVIHIDFSGTSGNVIHLDMMSFSEEVAGYRSNLFLNPSAVLGTTEVALVTSTSRVISSSSDIGRIGDTSFKLSSADATLRNLGIKNASPITFSEDQVVTGSAYVYSTKSASMSLKFTWQGPSSTSTASEVSVAANTWTRLVYTVTSPSGTTGLTFSVDASTTFSNTQFLYVDGLMVERSNKLGDFITGNAGTPYNSSVAKYGTFVYNPDSPYDIGYVYRDPKSVTVVCQPDRLNLVFNPTFETTPSAWSVVSGTLALSALNSANGANSGRVSGSPWKITGARIPTADTYSYGFSMVAFIESGTALGEINWYDPSDSLLRTDTVSSTQYIHESDIKWQQFSGVLTAPENSTYAVVSVTGSETSFISNVLFERADRQQLFFSGNISDLDSQDGRWSLPTTNAYSLLYNKAPIKMERLRSTLPYYLPVGVTARVLLWDSLDPYVQALVPRGIYS
jgi:hypothetical protein